MKRLFLILILFGAHGAFAICSPILGLGNIQLFDNNGKPLPTGVLYSFQAGTSTQQATYTDSTCLVLNNNPITMSSGGRAGIWLLGSNTYKFVACLQNDGPVCAPADVLFSVDNIPGVAGGTASPFVGTFISGSVNPATSGILELASSDLICWRNAANSANLCISKDFQDVLSWAGGDLKLPEINCVAVSAGFDYLCADSTFHRLSESGNGGIKSQIVVAGADINLLDQVTQLHFGAQATPLGSALSTGQPLIWDGTHLSGWVTVSPISPTTGQVLTATGTTTATWATPSNAILLHTNQFTITTSAIGNSNATVFSKAVTMPATGCPCRVFATWYMYFSVTAAGQEVAYVSDGTNNWAGSETATPGSATGMGFTGAGSSPVTYANNANVTFTVIMASSAAAGATVSASQLGTGITGAPGSQLSLDVIPSN
jgi:hypothetical protein